MYMYTRVDRSRAPLLLRENASHRRALDHFFPTENVPHSLFRLFFVHYYCQSYDIIIYYSPADGSYNILYFHTHICPYACTYEVGTLLTSFGIIYKTPPLTRVYKIIYSTMS